MSRVSLVGAVILGLLASASTTVLAQEEKTAPATRVTGTVVEQFGYTDGVPVGEEMRPGKHEYRIEEGVLHERGVISRQQVQWSDPRLPSEHWVRLDATLYGMDEPLLGVAAVESSHLLKGAEGSWRGTGRAIETADDRYSHYVLTGEGLYDGLYALLRGTPGTDMPGPLDRSYEGYIFEGELLPVVDPVEPVTWQGWQEFPDPSE